MNSRYRILYKDLDIEIYMIMDDEGERPLTYWYTIKNNNSGISKENVDIRKLNAFTQYFAPKKPSGLHITLHRTEIVPEIIKLAISNHELD